MEKRIVILGAGPTGLGAAYRLKELGYKNFSMYERHGHLGGLASSYRDAAGFTWDVGGHVMFSHYKYYDEVFDRLMGSDFQLNMRESWVRLAERWVPYPFQNNIRYLPKEMVCECLTGLIEAQSRGSSQNAANFEEFIDAVFGAGIVRHFMKPYNFKVWAHPPAMMNKTWIGERVAVIDIQRAVRNVVMESDDFGWGPNNQFKFPLLGGTGEFYRRFARPLEGHVHLNQTVEKIDLDSKLVFFQDGGIAPYDILISTMPLDKLCNNVLRGSVPQEVRTKTASLRHSGGYMVGIGIKQPCPSTKSWMYFPEDNCPFYRVTYLSNYSPFMTPDNKTHYSLLAETSYSEFKPVDGTRIVEDTIQGMVNCGLLKEEDRRDIVDTWVFDAPYSYPTPTVERDSILEQTLPFLEKHGIYSRGRFGLWKYEVSNTDHSLMQGVELANRLIQGVPESTMGICYPVEDDGRVVNHDAPAHAGNGAPSHSNGVVKVRRSNHRGPGERVGGHISEEELAIGASHIEAPAVNGIRQPD